MKKVLASISGALLAAVSVTALAQTELRLLNAFDSRYPGTPIVVD